MIIEWIIDSSVFEKTSRILAQRIAEKLTESICDQEEDRKYSKSVIEFLLDLSQTDQKSSTLIVNFVQKFGIDFFKKFFLSKIEVKLFTSINLADYLSVLCNNDVTIWQDVLFDQFISLFCQSGAQREKNSILKNDQNLTESL
ncbi:hypothetical protein BpHYR1_047254, partial [Brachionus plicatilis]